MTQLRQGGGAKRKPSTRKPSRRATPDSAQYPCDHCRAIKTAYTEKGRPAIPRPNSKVLRHSAPLLQRGTPIPMTITFPWGDQQFWGDWSAYNWQLGQLGAQPLECAFLGGSYPW